MSYLSAGAAVRDISPLHPLPLYGYPHVPRVSTGIHDPLLASALVLDNGAERVVLIAIDILFLDPPTARRLRERVARRTGTAEANVFVGCTHTHSGPVTTRLLSWANDPTIPSPDQDYIERILGEVEVAAATALSHLVPAELAWTAADARGVGGNRRQPDGLTDSECGVLVVRKANGGAPLAAALVYGMHPTILHEDSTLVSSDFPHYTRVRVQEWLGAEIPVLYFTAPAGDQSPRYYVKGQTFAEAERLGRMLGNAVVTALDALAPANWCAEARLAGAISRVHLPRRPFTAEAEAERQLKRVRAEYEGLKVAGEPRAKVRTAECSVFGAEGTLGLARAQARGQIDALLHAYDPIEVQSVRIGTVCLAGMPGESFTIFALEIKRQAPCRTFVVSLVNGELQGYIVSPEAETEGGYEATNSVFAPAAGTVLVRAAVELVKQLWRGNGLA